MTALPHALESLLSILVAVRQDDTSGAGVPSSLSLRQSYATALIRLVNGLVDPLQAGTYARSIFSIATQIGLPAWLVELRHAATHDDLPSLELLRDGANEVRAPFPSPLPRLTKTKQMLMEREIANRGFLYLIFLGPYVPSPSVGSYTTTFSPR
jgi:hypothetical protein